MFMLSLLNTLAPCSLLQAKLLILEFLANITLGECALASELEDNSPFGIPPPQESSIPYWYWNFELDVNGLASNLT